MHSIRSQGRSYRHPVQYHPASSALGRSTRLQGLHDNTVESSYCSSSSCSVSGFSWTQLRRGRLRPREASLKLHRLEPAPIRSRRLALSPCCEFTPVLHMLTLVWVRKATTWQPGHLASMSVVQQESMLCRRGRGGCALVPQAAPPQLGKAGPSLRYGCQRALTVASAIPFHHHCFLIWETLLLQSTTQQDFINQSSGARGSLWSW